MKTRPTAGLMSLLLVLIALLFSQLAVANDVGSNRTTFSGRAFAAFVNTPLTGPVYIADTGELSASGGALSSGLLSASVPGVLTADVLNASTSGSHGRADSTASLAEVTVFPGSATELRASFLRAQSNAQCAGAFGLSEIASLTFMGQTVTVTGAPNQTINVPGVATLVINEQAYVSRGNYYEVRVNAIHLTVAGVGEVILSSVKSDIKCVRDDTGPCFDFVTGGGYVKTSNGRANFGFNAGKKGKGPALSGHLNLVDNRAGVHVQGYSVTSYSGAGSTRTFGGNCRINGQDGFTYVCTVTDNGEPGTSDTFSITLSNGYSVSGTLAGGNIQIHAPCE